jgi:hypothetical protein
VRLAIQKEAQSIKLRQAPPLIAWAMRMCGFYGCASFWRTIYIMPGHEHNQRLLRHERKPLEQIERDGRLVFSIQYLWWLCRYGYYMNLYEVEARKAEKRGL